MRRVSVEIPGKPYPVLIGAGAGGAAGQYISGTCVVVADSSLEELPAVDAAVIRITGGEAAKSFRVVEEIVAGLAAARLGRDGTVIAVGGGTIGDVAGFAASVWQRGVALIHVPTTLLAMVDSAIGGKTAINTADAKNAVGTFWQPRAVLIDPRYLRTLPEEDLRAGQAEVLKYAMTLDPGIAELAIGDEMIERCVSCKARVVAEDERDSGRREILNYGHTVAHALESESGYRLHHGRAVAAGMRAAARISASLGLCDPALVEAQDRLLAERGLPGPLPSLRLDSVMSRLQSDKKVRDGRLRWVLLRRMGSAEAGHEAPSATVREAVAEILSA